MFICDSWCNCSWNDMPLFISSSYFIIHILYFTAVLHDSLEKDIMLFLLKCAIRHNKEIDNYNILIPPLPNPCLNPPLPFPWASQFIAHLRPHQNIRGPCLGWHRWRNGTWVVTRSEEFPSCRWRWSPAAASPPLHAPGPCQYQGKSILGMSCKSVNVEKLGHTSGDGSYIIGIISHCRHCGLNKSNGIQWKVHHCTFAFNWF